MDNQWKDWVVRYTTLYRKRFTKKQKEKFLRAFVTEISILRSDVKVFDLDDAGKAVFVGDVEHAKRVICTYYDTPPAPIRDYIYFQWEPKLWPHILASVLLLAAGILGTMYYAKTVGTSFTLFSVQTLLIIAIYIVYFWLLRNVASGNLNGKTAIRNTSSVLLLLDLLSKDSADAYAFVDYGCFGLAGVKAVRKHMKKNAKLLYLDCVGAKQPIQTIQKEKVTYLFSAQKAGDHYILKSDDLREQNLDLKQIQKVKKILEEA
ncbi:MAG: hypothetical protein ACOX1W_09365 [Catenisphaera adipataccumulans]|jgi:hypothetical protein|uniref:hypothetical protein n=1 Tax=Catenisphaera adipataccumulans TaxID=700500 RepID=UPI003D914696